jgi:glycosyltransferase involved in cell wall biosynthesis
VHIENRFLLNFSASYSEGGYKRLSAYADWFNRNGGAWFAIHPRCAELINTFPNNRFFVVQRSHLRRLYDDWRYLDSICRMVGRPQVYYAYGIPLYLRIGHVNWFHLTNVLTLGTRAIPLSMRDRLKLNILGRRIRRGLALADVISAESEHSLGLIEAIDGCGRARLLLSVNGSDDQLAFARETGVAHKDNIATVLGTYRYKALDESWRVFLELKSNDRELKLVIIGDADEVPAYLRRKADVIVCGMLDRAEVIDYLRRTKFYISTTYAENSSNAVSEGIFHAEQSFISDIGPNRELLGGSRFRQVSFAGLNRPLLHVRRNELSIASLKSWETVVSEWRTAALRALPNRKSAETDTTASALVAR